MWLQREEECYDCGHRPWKVTRRHHSFEWVRHPYTALVERCVPNKSLIGIGFVRWRIYERQEETRAVVTQIAAAFEISSNLLDGGGWWHGPKNIWKAWPSYDEIIARDLHAMLEFQLDNLVRSQLSATYGVPDGVRIEFSPRPEVQQHDISSPGQGSDDRSTSAQAQSGADHPVDKSSRVCYPDEHANQPQAQL